MNASPYLSITRSCFNSSHHLLVSSCLFLSSVMMTSLPGAESPERRLVELLAEQQEPFLLDVYLLENGFTKRSLNSEISAMRMCYPGIMYRRLQKLAGHCFKRHLALFAHGKEWKISNYYGKSPGAGGLFASGSMSGSSVTSIEQHCHSKGDSEGRLQWECMEDSKQLSPVSVLELHSEYSDSPVYEHRVKQNDPLNSRPSSRTKAATNRDRKLSIKRLNEEEKTKVAQMLQVDFSVSRMKLIQIDDQMMEIGTEMVDAIFEETIDDLVLAVL